ncbi:MAG: DUF4194 domain-containing protein [Treponema sp.]|nr:DUF4194 domain-containing protein [Treponema sp.]
MNEKIKIPEWGAVCVKLLQGPVYRTNAQDSFWNLLKMYLSDINDYFSKIGVCVFVDESDGYAFLRQIVSSQESDFPDEDFVENENKETGPLSDETEKRLANFPHLIKNYPLSIELSLLCVILRETLDQFDSSEDSSSMLVMKESEIKEKLMIFLPETSDQTKMYSKIDEYLNKLAELTFLREIKKNETSAGRYDREFEVRRIIRAKINAEFLEEFKRKLEKINGQ